MKVLDSFQALLVDLGVVHVGAVPVVERLLPAPGVGIMRLRVQEEPVRLGFVV